MNPQNAAYPVAARPVQVNDLHMNAAIRTDPDPNAKDGEARSAGRGCGSTVGINYVGTDGSPTRTEMAVATFDPKGAMQNHGEG
jgi:hypothetical protein